MAKLNITHIVNNEEKSCTFGSLSSLPNFFKDSFYEKPWKEILSHLNELKYTLNNLTLELASKNDSNEYRVSLVCQDMEEFKLFFSFFINFLPAREEKLFFEGKDLIPTIDYPARYKEPKSGKKPYYNKNRPF